MSTIIAGCFEQQDTAQHAIDELEQAGFATGQISSFYVNPAGQHARYPIGGDHDRSPGAQESGKGVLAGAATGGTVGAAVGATTAPVTGPIGPAVGAMLGAHIGSLVGSMNQMKDDGSGEQQEETPPLRVAGMYVAVALPDAGMEQQVVDILRSCGAGSVERAQGTIENGDWSDFDPASSPDYIVPSIQAPGGTSSPASVRKG